MSTIDYLPIAVNPGANVESQADFAGSGHQENGFSAGIAQSKQLNKCWRQSSMMAAAIANFIANTLGINVLDDGNLAELITNLTNAIINTGPRIASVNNTPVLITNSGDLMSAASPITAGVLNALGKAFRVHAAGYGFCSLGNQLFGLNFSPDGSIGYPNYTVIPYFEAISTADNYHWFLDIFCLVTGVGGSGQITAWPRMTVGRGTESTGIQEATPIDAGVIPWQFTANLLNALTPKCGMSLPGHGGTQQGQQSLLVVELLN